MSLSLTDLYRAVDHTYLKTLDQGDDLDIQKKHIKKLVAEAVASKAYSVCVQPHMVGEITKSEKLKISAVTGFPSIEVIDVRSSIEQVKELRFDVDEFDMVMDYRNLLAGNIQKVKDHVMRISDEVGMKTLKVIFENCYLSKDLIKFACEVLNQVFQDLDLTKSHRMAKTSTGFAPKSEFENIGAVLKDVECMRADLHQEIGIKIAGGIKDLNHAWEFFEACGSPMKDNAVDTRLFRIGSSSLIPSQIGGASY